MANFLNQGEMWGLNTMKDISLHLGEVCTNATRVFVQESVLSQFTILLLGEIEAKMRVGDPLDSATNVGATINEAHLNRILDVLERAKAQVL